MLQKAKIDGKVSFMLPAASRPVGLFPTCSYIPRFLRQGSAIICEWKTVCSSH